MFLNKSNRKLHKLRHNFRNPCLLANTPYIDPNRELITALFSVPYAPYLWFSVNEFFTTNLWIELYFTSCMKYTHC